jgi:hypothetical protein
MMLPTMARMGIIAVVLGAMLFVLGMIPGLFVAVVKGVERLRGHFFPSNGPRHRFQRDSGLSGDTWLLVGGAVVMTLGLQALLSR